MEISGRRTAPVAGQSAGRNSEQRHELQGDERGSLNDLRRFAAIAESAAIRAYAVAVAVTESGRGMV